MCSLVALAACGDMFSGNGNDSAAADLVDAGESMSFITADRATWVFIDARIVSEDGLCLDAGARRSSFAACNGTASQNWRRLDDALVSADALCLETSGELAECRRSPRQIWEFRGEDERSLR
jgi:hypothetical protein